MVGLSAVGDHAPAVIFWFTPVPPLHAELIVGDILVPLAEHTDVALEQALRAIGETELDLSDPYLNPEDAPRGKARVQREKGGGLLCQSAPSVCSLRPLCSPIYMCI